MCYQYSFILICYFCTSLKNLFYIMLNFPCHMFKVGWTNKFNKNKVYYIFSHLPTQTVILKPLLIHLEQLCVCVVFLISGKYSTDFFYIS